MLLSLKRIEKKIYVISFISKPIKQKNNLTLRNIEIENHPP